MKISRWTAEVIPTKKIIENLFLSEGLELKEITVHGGAKVTQRTLMTEVIQVIEGELIFNLSGTQFALRTGDRLELAANTHYSYNNIKNEKSVFLTANKL